VFFQCMAAIYMELLTVFYLFIAAIYMGRPTMLGQCTAAEYLEYLTACSRFSFG